MRGDDKSLYSVTNIQTAVTAAVCSDVIDFRLEQVIISSFVLAGTACLEVVVHASADCSFICATANYFAMQSFAYLFVVDSADALFLQRQTGLTWGNLSSHISKLESAGYVEVTKEFLDKKPHTALRLTEKGRVAFKEYRQNMKQMFESLH